MNVCQPLYITGFAAPNLRDVDGTFELLVGSEKGYLYRYGNIDGNLAGNFTLIDSVSWNIWEGGKIAPVTGDLNGDDVADLILGNLDGGICFYKGDSLLSGISNETIHHTFFSVYPTPATDLIVVRFEDKQYQERTIELLDFSGRLVKKYFSIQPVVETNAHEMSEGVYFLRCSKGDLMKTKKIIITR